MRIEWRFVAVVPLALAAAAALAAPHPDMKTGEWEFTRITKSGGDRSALIDMAKLTPEQRTRVEETLKHQATAPAKTTVRKRCLTQTDLDKALDKVDAAQAGQKCSINKTEVDAHHFAVKRECTDDSSGATMYFESHMDVLSPVAVRGTTDIRITRSGKTSTDHNDISGKWLGAVCAKTPPGLPQPPEGVGPPAAQR